MKDWRLNGRARHTLGVMAGHSRPKDGVLSHAYVPAIHVFAVARPQDVDARHKAGHDDEREGPIPRLAGHDTRRTKRRDGRLSLVMAGRSRPKDGVLSHAYAPGHYARALC
ncbi:MAG: hypothetical protein WBE93_12730, partial [Pseudolabrys sp.]